MAVSRHDATPSDQVKLIHHLRGRNRRLTPQTPCPSDQAKLTHPRGGNLTQAARRFCPGREVGPCYSSASEVGDARARHPPWTAQGRGSGRGPPCIPPECTAGLLFRRTRGRTVCACGRACEGRSLLLGRDRLGQRPCRQMCARSRSGRSRVASRALAATCSQRPGSVAVGPATASNRPAPSSRGQLGSRAPSRESVSRDAVGGRGADRPELLLILIAASRPGHRRPSPQPLADVWFELGVISFGFEEVACGRGDGGAVGA